MLEVECRKRNIKEMERRTHQHNHKSEKRVEKHEKYEGMFCINRRGGGCGWRRGLGSFK